MKAETLAGYDREERERAEEPDDYPYEYPFCLIRIVSKPESGEGKRVAVYVEYGALNDRESRLFVERSPPNMNWLEKVFNLIQENDSRGIVSGGLHEIRIHCENQIEIVEDEPAMIDHEEGKVYYDNGSAGDIMGLEARKRQ